jgi:hypothetical protein
MDILRLVCILLFTVSLSAQLQHTSQTSPTSSPTGNPVSVKAASANEFIDSIGVVTHFNYPSYKREHLEPLKSLLVASGIRHIRDSDFWTLDTFRSLAAHGIRVTWLEDPALGVIPSRSYWCNRNGGPRDCYLLGDFLKTKVGTGVFEAIETINEPDMFFGHYKWHAGEPSAVDGNREGPQYWRAYALSLTKDVCSVLHQDPALSYLKCVGPALGTTPDRFPPGSLYGVVDYGNMHPYPRGGNGSAPPLNYDTLRMYFHWGNSPALNLDEHPYAFNSYRPAFTGPTGDFAPMVATETGYCTGTARASISLQTHAKYMPRLFAEYFRHGVVRTFSYEFFDEGDDRAKCESNFGLINHDLGPKPAYVAIASLINLLKDSNSEFSPGTVTYSLKASPVGAFNRLQYVHDLLLQRSTGEYFLLLWHEVSDAATSDGTRFTSTAVDINPPPAALPVTVKLPDTVLAATLYSYGLDWKLQPKPTSLRDGEITLPVGDKLTVIQFLGPSTDKPNPPMLNPPHVRAK